MGGVAESQKPKESLYREFQHLDYEDRRRELTEEESARLAYLDAILFDPREWVDEEEDDDAEG